MRVANNIHIIVGTDDFLSDRAARAIVARVVPADLRADASVETIEGEASNEESQLRNLGALEESIFTPPFLEPFKITWWRNVSYLPVQGKGPGEAVKVRLVKLAQTLAANPLPENQHLIVTAPAVQATSVFFKTFRTIAEVQQFAVGKYARDRVESACDMVRTLAEELGLQIDDGAVNALVAKSGTNSRKLLSELEKMSTYLDADDRRITRDTVDAVASAGGEEPESWDLTDAIGARDLAKTLAVLARYEDKTGNGIMLANTTERFFRHLAASRDAQDRNVSDPELLAQAGLAGSPFMLRKLAAAARNYSPLELRVARYRLLAVREKLVSSYDATWRDLLENELCRIVPRRGVRR